jgi:predicted outer membrane repeat protein
VLANGKFSTTITINGGTISDNNHGDSNANGDGGVNNQSGDSVTTINGGSITGNYSKTNGGGVNVAGELTINGGSITDNTATQNGGGVYVKTLANLTVAAGVVFDDNTA